MLTEAILIARELGNRRALAYAADIAIRCVGVRAFTERVVQFLAVGETGTLPRLPRDRDAREHVIKAVRSSLGQERFVAAWTAGQTMSNAQIAEGILELLEPPSKVSPPTGTSVPE